MSFKNRIHLIYDILFINGNKYYCLGSQGIAFCASYVIGNKLPPYYIFLTAYHCVSDYRKGFRSLGTSLEEKYITINNEEVKISDIIPYNNEEGDLKKYDLAALIVKDKKFNLTTFDINNVYQKEISSAIIPGFNKDDNEYKSANPISIFWQNGKSFAEYNIKPKVNFTYNEEKIKSAKFDTQKIGFLINKEISHGWSGTPIIPGYASNKVLGFLSSAMKTDSLNEKFSLIKSFPKDILNWLDAIKNNLIPRRSIKLKFSKDNGAFFKAQCFPDDFLIDGVPINDYIQR